MTCSIAYTSNYSLLYYEFEHKNDLYVVDASSFTEKMNAKGMGIDFSENYINKYEPINKQIFLSKNYNLSTFEDQTLVATMIDQSLSMGTTTSNNFINQSFTAVALYTSNYGLTYYGFMNEGNYYVVNSRAAE